MQWKELLEYFLAWEFPRTAPKFIAIAFNEEISCYSSMEQPQKLAKLKLSSDPGKLPSLLFLMLLILIEGV
jgi:hypothetical protein